MILCASFLLWYAPSAAAAITAPTRTAASTSFTQSSKLFASGIISPTLELRDPHRKPHPGSFQQCQAAANFYSLELRRLSVCGVVVPGLALWRRVVNNLRGEKKEPKEISPGGGSENMGATSVFPQCTCMTQPPHRFDGGNIRGDTHCPIQKSSWVLRRIDDCNAINAGL